MNQAECHSAENFEGQQEVQTRWYLHLLQDESGQDLIEYALLTGFITLGAVASMNTIGAKVSAIFTSISTAI